MDNKQYYVATRPGLIIFTSSSIKECNTMIRNSEAKENSKGWYYVTDTKEQRCNICSEHGRCLAENSVAGQCNYFYHRTE